MVVVCWGAFVAAACGALVDAACVGILVAVGASVGTDVGVSWDTLVACGAVVALAVAAAELHAVSVPIINSNPMLIIVRDKLVFRAWLRYGVGPAAWVLPRFDF